MKFSPETARMFQDLLHWRRDVRHFLTDSIPEPLVAALEDAMAFAPSVGNARPWRVIRVDDPALRAGVRRIFETCNAKAAAGYDDERRQRYVALKLAGLDAAPLQLAVFTECDPAEGSGLGRQTIPETLQQSTSMAIHTLWLTARSLNLGLGMVSILDRAEIEGLFAVPSGWRFTAYLCVGWPAFDDDKPLLHRAGWQENTPTRWTKR